MSVVVGWESIEGLVAGGQGGYMVGLPPPEPRVGARGLPLLVRQARERAWRVIVVAERPELAQWAAVALRDRYGVLAVGVAAPGVPADGRGPWVDRLLERIALTRPHLVLVSMAAPTQELFCQYAATRLQPAVLVGAGAELESLLDGTRVKRGWLERCRRLLTQGLASVSTEGTRSGAASRSSP